MMLPVFQRRTTGSVVCPSCGSLVGVRDDKCYSCGRANPGLWGFAPILRQLGTDLGFVPLTIGASTIIYGLSLLSASWLHGSLLHIVFNMMAARNLGLAKADLIGPSRTVIIYTVSGVTGFLLSSTVGVPYTMGASASICGLLGAMLHYGRKSGSSMIHTYALQYALMLVVMGFAMRGIDNYAHAGGFAGGYVVSAFFNPLTRERGDHMLVAVICLVASFLAIVYSVIHGFGVGLYP